MYLYRGISLLMLFLLLKHLRDEDKIKISLVIRAVNKIAVWPHLFAKFGAKNRRCGLYTRPLLSGGVNWL